MALPSLDDYFPDWKEREALAEATIPLIGKLYSEERRGVLLRSCLQPERDPVDESPSLCPPACAKRII